MNINPKHTPPRWILLPLLAGSLLSAWFLFRGILIRQRITARSGWEWSWNGWTWTSWDSFRVDSVTARGDEQQVMFSATGLHVTLNPFEYIFGGPPVEELGWREAFVYRTSGAERNNSATVFFPAGVDPFPLLHSIRRVPRHLNLMNTTLASGPDSLRVEFTQLYLGENHSVEMQAAWKGRNQEAVRITVSGALAVAPLSGNLSVRMDGGGVLQGNATLRFLLDETEGLNVFASGKDMTILAAALHHDTLHVKDADAEGVIRNENGVSKYSVRLLLDGAGRVQAEAGWDPQAKAWDFHAEIPEQNARMFFASLPRGAFDHVRNAEVSGDISLGFFLHVPVHDPAGVKFHSEDHTRTLAIRNSPFQKMMQPFRFSLRQDRQRTAWKSAEWVKVQDLPASLRNAVLTAEDPAFFTHEGWDDEGIEAAIRENLIDRRFSRGGSSIPMQCVRNFILGDAEKTLFRKAEEMLMVCLMENEDRVDRTRMLELYLNLIEWGPDVYGAEEAARYYFGKPACRLNLAESLWLASLIPNPRAWRSSLDENDRPREQTVLLMDALQWAMQNKGMLDEGADWQDGPLIVRNFPAPSGASAQAAD